MSNTVMLSLTNAIANSNKFYEITVEGDSVLVRYGRIGAAGQRKTYTGGQAKADELQRAKERKGYTVVDIAGNVAGSRPASATVHEALTGGSAAMRDVVDYLCAKNAHDIATTSGGTMTVKEGVVTTPLGPLSRSALAQARTLLSDLELSYPPVNAHLLEAYLRCVPQDVGRRTGWQERFISSQSDFVTQRTFLDQLEAGLDASSVSDAAVDFRYRLEPETDASVIDQMQRDYNATANAAHGSAARARVKAVYRVIDNNAEAVSAFETLAATKGNVQTLWHGTRAANLLSILAVGFRLPRASDTHTAGDMFGRGLYFSNQSSKSANYARGGVWSTGRDQRWFMLRADVIMGNAYRPTTHRGSSYYSGILSGGRYDSIDVKPGKAGVRNHEAIVPGPESVNVRYVIEFEG